MKHVDLIIVGAGFLGLAHAYHAARRGLNVTVIERDAHAAGASVQNFGMLATIAQKPGPTLDRALRTRETWREIAAKAGVSLTRNGCLILAGHDDECEALRAFAASEHNDDAAFLTPDRLAEQIPAARPGLLGGLWAPNVWKLDQRNAPAKIASWLSQEYGVEFLFGTAALAIDSPSVETSAGTLRAPAIIVCGGHEFSTLFPEHFAAAGVTVCQLQMLRTAPQRSGWRLGPFILGGLSMARYAAFDGLPGMASVRARLARTRPDHVAHGIHVIACQEADGAVTIGDSHVYGDTPPRSDEIDRLMLETADEMIALPDARIAERWLGRYAHLDGTDLLRIAPQPGVTLVTMTNGQGLTHCFGLAETVVSETV